MVITLHVKLFMQYGLLNALIYFPRSNIRSMFYEYNKSDVRSNSITFYVRVTNKRRAVK